MFGSHLRHVPRLHTKNRSILSDRKKRTLLVRSDLSFVWSVGHTVLRFI